MKFVLLDEFKPFKDRFVYLDMIPLEITIELFSGSSILQYNPIYIDSLLQNVVVQQAMRGKKLMTSPNIAYDIPIPIKTEWEMPTTGLPLFASTCLFPIGEYIEGTVYYHKRSHSGKFSRGKRGKKSPLKIVTIMGPDMERRIPTPSIIANKLRGFCIGNMDQVRELFSFVTTLGKRRNLGNNTIKSIEVDKADKFSFVGDSDLLMRSIPVEYAEEKGTIFESNSSILAWTPPYWKSSLYSIGYRTGDRLVYESDEDSENGER